MSLQTLEETARTLAAAAAGRKPFASLFFFTDPERTPDPVSAARRLPAGAAVVYRAFGSAEATIVAAELRQVTRERDCLLLIGADEALAEACGADGLHLPEHRLPDGPALRLRHPGWFLTGAAHSAEALAEANRAGLDAVMISPVFASRSPSAGEPLGVVRLSELARGSAAPVIALGGVNAQTAGELLGSGAAGLAGVEAFGA